MPATVKSTLRDKLEDDILDLSLMQMNEVPVQELALLPKGTTVDLSNNLLVRLPENFPTLTHIVKLDLSKNRLEELPEYFGQLKNLRQLDLYSNQIQRLPVSFCQLKSLKWLDLKNNPLVPALQQAAGPCITASDCAVCAKKVVALMKDMQAQMERERQRIAIEEQKREEQRRMVEEQERERVKAEKKALKAKSKKKANKLPAQTEPQSTTSTESHSNGSGDKRTSSQSSRPLRQHQSEKNSQQSSKSNSGCCWTLFMVLLSVAMLAIGAAVSTLWIYTGGRLDQASIERALPVISRDVDALFHKASLHFNDFSINYVQPLRKRLASDTQWLMAELERRHKLAAYYINENLGPSFCAAKKQFFIYFEQSKMHLQHAFERSKPYLRHFQAQCYHYTQILVDNVKLYVPMLIDQVYLHGSHAVAHIQQVINNLIN